MELVVLFAIVALFIFGPRRGGGMPSKFAMIAGAAFLLWMLMAFGMGAIWNAIVGTERRPAAVVGAGPTFNGVSM